MQRQQQDQWCWAAVTVSVATYYGVDTDLTQCRLVNAVFNLETCCNDGGTDACNRPWYLDRALNWTRMLKRAVPGAPAELDEVRAEIDSGRPVGVHIHWRGGDAGHFIAIEGYREDEGMFAIEDSWSGTSDIDVRTLLSSYNGTGDWTYTYYTSVPE